MKVKISWVDCKNQPYLDTKNCPLAYTLNKLGLDHVRVGGVSVSINNRVYYFKSHDWAPSVQSRAARGHRSVWVEIPGLEREFEHA